MPFVELLNHFNERVTVIQLIHLNAFLLQNTLVVYCNVIILRPPNLIPTWNPDPIFGVVCNQAK